MHVSTNINYRKLMIVVVQIIQNARNNIFGKSGFLGYFLTY